MKKGSENDCGVLRSGSYFYLVNLSLRVSAKYQRMRQLH